MALPLNMFYNTGIATYIWVLSNRKPAQRQGLVQLIDATQSFVPLRKNLGQKNCELSADNIRRLCDAFLGMEESEQSKVYPNAHFGYWKVTVERPLRLSVDLSPAARARFRHACQQAADPFLADLVDQLSRDLGAGPHRDWNAFLRAAEHKAGKLSAKRSKLLQAELATRDANAEPVIARVDKTGHRAADPLYGRYSQHSAGRPVVVEYQPDTELRDTEQVPLLEPGGIEAFIRREVLPYAPDAWIDAESVRTGYEISFTRYFYKPQPLRSLDEIRADILALERESDGLLGQIVGGDA